MKSVILILILIVALSHTAERYWHYSVWNYDCKDFTIDKIVFGEHVLVDVDMLTSIVIRRGELETYPDRYFVWKLKFIGGARTNKNTGEMFINVCTWGPDPREFWAKVEDRQTYDQYVNISKSLAGS